jgi:hypothetical protein
MSGSLIGQFSRQKTRRGVLALLGAGGAAAITALAGRRNSAQAATGDALIAGQANSADASTGLSADIPAVAGEFPPFALDVSLQAGAGAIFGHNQHGVGIVGQSEGGDPPGTGLESAGVRGISNDNGTGVEGFSHAPSPPGMVLPGSGVGVSGRSGSGPGVSGSSDSGAGVEGGSDSGMGGFFRSQSGVGVAGGTDTGFAGVDGFNPNGAGVNGTSETGPGVTGNSQSGPGVRGSSQTDTGVAGHTESGRAAGVFLNQHGPYGVQAGVFARWDDLEVMPVAVQGISIVAVEDGFARGPGVGVEGSSGSGTGVAGNSESGSGGNFSSQTGVGAGGHSGGRTGVLGATFGEGVAGIFGFRDKPDGLGAGVAGGAPGDTPAVLARSGAPPPPPEPSPPKGGPPDGPDLLVPDGGVALRVEGKAQFSTCGAGVIPHGRNSYFVASPDVRVASHVSLTLARDPGPRQVQWIEAVPGEGFTIHLTAAPRLQRPATPFTYFIVETAPSS